MDEEIIISINKAIQELHYATLDIRSMRDADREDFLRKNEERLKSLASYIQEEKDNILSWYR